jgi:hypothetical protein
VAELAELLVSSAGGSDQSAGIPKPVGVDTMPSFAAVGFAARPV